MTHILQLLTDPAKNIWAYCACGWYNDFWVTPQAGVEAFQRHLRGLSESA